AFLIEERLITVEDRLVGMHAAAVVPMDRLRHEGGCLAPAAGGVVDDVFVLHQMVRALHQGVVTEVDLALSGRCDFMMMPLDPYACGDEQTADLRAKIMQAVYRLDGNITAFRFYFEAEVAAFFLSACIPMAFDGINAGHIRVLRIFI